MEDVGEVRPSPFSKLRFIMQNSISTPQKWKECINHFLTFLPRSLFLSPLVKGKNIRGAAKSSRLPLALSPDCSPPGDLPLPSSPKSIMHQGARGGGGQKAPGGGFPIDG